MAKILRGDVKLARMRAYARHAVGGRARLPRTSYGSRVETSIDRELGRLRDVETRLVLAFSGAEALHVELWQAGILGRLAHWPNIELERLPGRDQTLRPIIAQRALHELLDRQLERELVRIRHRANCVAEVPARPDGHDQVRTET